MVIRRVFIARGARIIVRKITLILIAVEATTQARIGYTRLSYVRSFIAIRGGNRNFESETTLIIG